MARIIAFYLPQFHPFKENDEWWGKGFTEWTNVGRAKPMFRGHVQPKIPRDLGYYDLRVPETREEQARLAKYAGIEGFCYWHYWFGNGKRLMERPFNEVLASGKPDYPFCLGWANHSWLAKNWNTSDVRGRADKVLIEQQYGGVEDYTLHFNTMLPAFRDKRYIRVENRPLFVIWQPEQIPSFQEFKDTWNRLALENGLSEFYFVGFAYGAKKIKETEDLGLDALCVDYMFDAFLNKKNFFNIYKRKVLKFFRIPKPLKLPYHQYVKYCVKQFESSGEQILPCVVSNYDHSPRSKGGACVLTKQSPSEFVYFLEKVIQLCSRHKPERNLVFVKAWNEWGEGNYLEPDMEFGDEYIQSMHRSFGGDNR